jgi:hypothetical protein
MSVGYKVIVCCWFFDTTCRSKIMAREYKVIFCCLLFDLHCSLHFVYHINIIELYYGGCDSKVEQYVLFILFVICLCIVVSNTYCALFFVFFYLRLVYPKLPVSLNCPCLIAPAVYSNIYS